MHLTELAVADFLPYREARLPFGANGLVLVIGPNNAGKSALLAALDVVAGTARGGNWRRAGSTEFARVTATFAIDDDGERDFILGEGAHAGWMENLRGIRFEWEDRTASEMLLTSIDVVSDREVIGTIATAEYMWRNWSLSTIARSMVFEQPPSDANWELTARIQSGGPLTPEQATGPLPGSVSTEPEFRWLAPDDRGPERDYS
jgi:hypothetical protein